MTARRGQRAEPTGWEGWGLPKAVWKGLEEAEGGWER